MHIAPLPTRHPRTRFALVGSRLWALSDPSGRGRTCIDVLELDGTEVAEKKLDVDAGVPVVHAGLAWLVSKSTVVLDVASLEERGRFKLPQYTFALASSGDVAALSPMEKPKLVRLTPEGVVPLPPLKLADKIEGIEAIDATTWLVGTVRKLHEVTLEDGRVAVTRVLDLPRTPRRIIVDAARRVATASDEMTGAVSGASAWRIDLESFRVTATRDGLTARLLPDLDGRVAVHVGGRLLQLDDALVDARATALEGENQVRPLAPGLWVAQQPSGPRLVDGRGSR